MRPDVRFPGRYAAATALPNVTAVARRVAIVLATVSLLLGAGTSAAGAATTPNPQDTLAPGCKFLDVAVPASVLAHQIVPLPMTTVNALDGDVKTLTIHGELCMPTSGPAPKTVMLAVHGILYNGGYWDIQYQPQTYNYADYMTKAGYAVFAIDRLGYGQSSKPPAELVTIDSGAAVLHQLIGMLRAGDIGGVTFPDVLLTGYSYGSGTSWLETSEYNDANALLTTAWGNTFDNTAFVRIFSQLEPAQLNPEFADRPAGYMTFGSARDSNLFYDPTNVDPGMVAYSDQYFNDTITLGEIATFYPRYGAFPVGYYPFSSTEAEIPLPTGDTRAIKIPTFLIDGNNELFFCGLQQIECRSSQDLQLSESQYFTQPSACFRAAVIPNAGHNLNEQLNAPYTFSQMLTFANQVLGPDGSNLAAYQRTCAAFSGTHVQPGPAEFGDLGGPPATSAPSASRAHIRHRSGSKRRARRGRRRSVNRRRS